MEKVYKIDYNDFRVSYFSPWDAYYISNGRENYLTAGGCIGPVFYYKSKEEADSALARFKKTQ